LAASSPLLLAFALWSSVQLSEEALTGLRVGGEEIPGRRALLLSALELRAQAWSGGRLEIGVEGLSETVSVERALLGASLPVADTASAALNVGRSGNPVADLAAWYRARRGELDVRWLPVIEREVLTQFVDEQQERAELHAIAGVTDGRGWSLPGRDGRALDHASAMRVLASALYASASRVVLPVKHVPAPLPIALGSPDGELFAEQEPTFSSSRPPPPPSHAGNERDNCFHQPPQRPFCDGPRDVPVPFGPAHERARSLGLGELSTVEKLLKRGPSENWVAAAGPADGAPMMFPVPSGKVGRGFGFVRKGELKDRIHPGIDVVAPLGAVVRAISDGVVAYSDNRIRGYGNVLFIVHANGAFSLSAHCRRILVFAGQRVTRGQPVAEVGMTGLAMGPHLHFEYHDGPGAVDPLARLEEP
jgi:murein DD-endopeptidase MepM/ murein hydrolase activator NlpD